MDDVADCAPGDQTPPGAYLAVFAEGLDGDRVSIEARRMGLVLRDTILVVGPERISFVLIFRRPSGRTIVEDAQFGFGVLNVAASRVGDFKNPNAFEGYVRTQVGRWGMKASKGRDREASAPIGRWPPNVLFVDGRLARHLDASTHPSGYPPSKFFPLLPTTAEVRAWVEKLLAVALRDPSRSGI